MSLSAPAYACVPMRRFRKRRSFAGAWIVMIAYRVGSPSWWITRSAPTKTMVGVLREQRANRKGKHERAFQRPERSASGRLAVFVSRRASAGGGESQTRVPREAGRVLARRAGEGR